MEHNWGDSPIITRFISHVQNNATIEEIARQADMALKTAMRAAVHLVIHNIAVPIFPIRSNSIYILSPHAKLELLQDRMMMKEFDKLKESYYASYPHSLIKTVSDFSSQYSLLERVQFSHDATRQE